MATIRKCGDSYQIWVSSGYDSQYRQVVRTKTWKPTPGMTARQVENELNRQTVMTACPKKCDTSLELSFRCVQLRFKAGNAGK